MPSPPKQPFLFLEIHQLFTKRQNHRSGILIKAKKCQSAARILFFDMTILFELSACFEIETP